MNKKEKLKSAVIQSYVEGNMTVKVASKKLGYTERHIKTLKRRYKKYGTTSMMYGNCGRQPKNTISADIKSKIIQIWNDPKFEYCNFSHFQEKLEEIYNIKISYTALYNLLTSHGYRSPRKHRKAKAHNRRNERKTTGELLQADATPFEFFANDSKKYALHAFIDDATHKITGLYMCEHECMQGYLEVTRQTLKNFGIPVALYADSSSIFFSTKKDKLSIEDQLNGLTKPKPQYTQMMDVLGVEIIRASSSQAKGRIERLWDTLHDRLRTEFRIQNITNVDDANKFLKTYIPKYNKKFSIEPYSNNSSFIKLPSYIDLNYLLSVKFIRTVDVSNCFSLQGTIFAINTKEILHKKKIEVCISRRIGIKAYLNNKWYEVTPIVNSNKKSLKSNDSIKAIIQKFVYDNCLKNERLSA